MEFQIEHIRNLLGKVKLITEKYDEIERITGEKFNVFSILGLSSDELAHSKFIANLLNPKGSHGQGDLYLRLFISNMKQKFLNGSELDLFIVPKDSNIHLLNKFEANNTKCVTEKHVGKLNFTDDEGGRIDILLTSGTNQIIIENKVYAGDQHKQLMRYHTFDKQAPIFYLSLFDENSVSNSSKQSLTEGKEFFRISYENDIRIWLEECIQHAASIPFIRETLRQYVNLIKRLTNQETNSMKNNNLIELILTENNSSYLDSLIQLDSIKSDLKWKLTESVIDSLKEMSKKFENHQFAFNIKKESKWDSFSITNRLLLERNLKISFTFNNSSKKNRLIYGFVPVNKEKALQEDLLLIKFEKEFKKITTSSHNWLCFNDSEKFSNWESLSFLKNHYYDQEFREEFKAFFSNKIELLFKIFLAEN